MTAVNLEALRADFEAKRDHIMRVYGIPDPHVWRHYDFFPIAIEWPEDRDFCNFNVLFDHEVDEVALRVAANVLDVAIGFGLEAAMLYKLSGGNIDPRGGQPVG